MKPAPGRVDGVHIVTCGMKMISAPFWRSALENLCLRNALRSLKGHGKIEGFILSQTKPCTRLRPADKDCAHISQNEWEIVVYYTNEQMIMDYARKEGLTPYPVTLEFAQAA